MGGCWRYGDWKRVVVRRLLMGHGEAIVAWLGDGCLGLAAAGVLTLGGCAVDRGVEGIDMRRSVVGLARISWLLVSAQIKGFRFISSSSSFSSMTSIARRSGSVSVLTRCSCS